MAAACTLPGVEARTLRQTASAPTLLRAALGGPRKIAGKLGRLRCTLGLWLDGPHPRARSIGAIVEDAGYHARLLEYVALPTRLGPLWARYRSLERFPVELAQEPAYA